MNAGRLAKIRELLAEATPPATSDIDSLSFLTDEERAFWEWGMSYTTDGKLVALSDSEFERMEYLSLKADVLSGEKIDEDLLSVNLCEMVKKIRAEKLSITPATEPEGNCYE